MGIEFDKDCISKYPHLESSFEEFKRRYNEGDNKEKNNRY